MDESCKFALCPECFIEEHFSHKKARLEDVWEANKLSVNAALKSLEERKGPFDAKVSATDEEIRELTK